MKKLWKFLYLPPAHSSVALGQPSFFELQNVNVARYIRKQFIILASCRPKRGGGGHRPPSLILGRGRIAPIAPHFRGTCTHRRMTKMSLCSLNLFFYFSMHLCVHDICVMHLCVRDCHTFECAVYLSLEHQTIIEIMSEPLRLIFRLNQFR